MSNINGHMGNSGGIPFSSSFRMEAASDVEKIEEAVDSSPLGKFAGWSVAQGKGNFGHLGVGGNLRGAQRSSTLDIDAFLQGMNSQVKGMYTKMAGVAAKHKVSINVVQIHEKVTEAFGELTSPTDSDISKVRQRLLQEVAAEIKEKNPGIEQEAMDEIMEAFDGAVDAVLDQMQFQASKGNASNDQQSSSSSSSLTSKAVNFDGPKKKMDDTAILDDAQKRIEETSAKLGEESLALKREHLEEAAKDRAEEQMRNNSKK